MVRVLLEVIQVLLVLLDQVVMEEQIILQEVVLLMLVVEEVVVMVIFLKQLQEAGSVIDRPAVNTADTVSQGAPQVGLPGILSSGGAGGRRLAGVGRVKPATWLLRVFMVDD